MKKKSYRIASCAIFFAIASTLLPNLTLASGGGPDITPTEYEKDYQTMDCVELGQEFGSLTDGILGSEEDIAKKKKDELKHQKIYRESSLRLEKLNSAIKNEQDNAKKKSLKKKIKSENKKLKKSKRRLGALEIAIDRAESELVREKTEMKTLKKWQKSRGC